MALNDVPYANVTELAEAYKSRSLSPVEVTRQMIERIERLDPTLRSYVTVTADIALEQARKAEEEIGNGRIRGPMHGVPVGIKDLCETKGVKTTWGSKILADYVPDADCTVVSKLYDAGAFVSHSPSLAARVSVSTT